MTVTITTLATPATTLANTFVAKVKFMSGDADHYDDIELLLRTEEEVERFVKLMRLCESWGGRHGYYRPYETESRINYGYPRYKQPGDDGYLAPLPDVERELFAEFFGMSDDPDEHWIDEWPRDVTYSDIYQALDGYKVFWYDAVGRKYNVEVS